MGNCQSGEDDEPPKWEQYRCLTLQESTGKVLAHVDVFQKDTDVRWLLEDCTSDHKFAACLEGLRSFAKFVAWRFEDGVTVQSLLHRQGTVTPLSEQHLYDLLKMHVHIVFTSARLFP